MRSRSHSGRARWALTLAAGSLTLGTAAHSQTSGASVAGLRGGDLYQAACASCHGSDGRGRPIEVVGFDVPIPDFTECSFATPEADADWAAVIRHGGPVRGFARNMPAFGRALSDEQIQSVLDYIRTMCDDGRWPRGELNLPRALFTEKAFPENETVLTVGLSRDPGAISTELLYERRIGTRGQYEVILPFELHRADGGPWRQGLGDVELAYKHALAHSLERGSILSAGLEVALPTGSESRAFGSGHSAIAPFLAYGQILPRDAFIHVFGGAEFPMPKRGNEAEVKLRAALGRTFVEANDGRAWSPMVEALATRELESGAPIAWDIVPQMQVSLNTRQHILFSAGVRIPVTEKQGRKPTLAFYLLWDWFDGGLREGW